MAADPPKVTVCESCNVALVRAQVRDMASAKGILGIALVVIGIVLAPFWFGWGFLTIIVGILISFFGGKKAVMVCPNCGRHGRTDAT
jgi:predicted RNA-binding Zn-ribbon protein involved in translation (DUF1610 family)